ncbi:FHA domain-containing protein [Flexivirga caeni]|uniref:FHA domain-containing protein n=1 Tax=Flexivirga caeni TaxID=2294115 RepID=A0A3M9MB82_9MICO|nr:FHA domain-containing protein [Flexivirga caeni]RNI22806.1 FHA domain-containing protein [Flexivirga caeni]
MSNDDSGFSPENVAATPAQEIGSDATARISATDGAAARPSVSSDVRLSATDQATIDALRPGTALLLALRGANAGARFLLDDAEVSVGRHPSSDIFLDDVTVSRRHAVFRRTDAGYAVTDVGSLNGTYVNGALVDSQDLRTGDEVMVGKFRLVFYGAPTS